MVAAIGGRILRESVISVYVYDVYSAMKNISRSSCRNWRCYCAVHLSRRIGKTFDTLHLLHARAVWVQADRQDQWHWLDIYNLQLWEWVWLCSSAWNLRAKSIHLPSQGGMEAFNVFPNHVRVQKAVQVIWNLDPWSLMPQEMPLFLNCVPLSIYSSAYIPFGQVPTQQLNSWKC